MDKKRARESEIASVIGFVSNLVLASLKVIIGVMSGLMSVTSDGLNNFGDLGMNVVGIVSIKFSQKPPDKEHPYGHERIEYVATLVMSVVILTVAVEVLKSSTEAIFNPKDLSVEPIVFCVQCFSILAKMGMFLYYMWVFKKTKSLIMKANAFDSLFDVISTLGIVLGLTLSEVVGINLDGYIGVIVGVIIGVCGLKNLLAVSSKIIGQGVDKDTKLKIENYILGNGEVMGIHDLTAFSYGSKIFASVHIELDARLSSLESHKIIDKIERGVNEKFGVMLSAHHDPVLICDKETNVLREMVTRIVKMLSQKYSLHDFRLQRGERSTSVIFDLAIPYDERVEEKELTRFLTRKIKALNVNYEPIIKIDRV